MEFVFQAQYFSIANPHPALVVYGTAFVVFLPALTVKNINTQLRQHRCEVHSDPIVSDLPIPDFPEISVFDFRPLACGRDTHEFSAVYGINIAKRCDPFALREACFLVIATL